MADFLMPETEQPTIVSGTYLLLSFFQGSCRTLVIIIFQIEHLWSPDYIDSMPWKLVPIIADP